MGHYGGCFGVFSSVIVPKKLGEFPSMGEVSPTASGDRDFPTRLFLSFQNEDLRAVLGRRNSREKPRRTATHNHGVPKPSHN
jgi:hypothetical protein